MVLELADGGSLYEFLYESQNPCRRSSNINGWTSCWAHWIIFTAILKIPFYDTLGEQPNPTNEAAKIPLGLRPTLPENPALPQRLVRMIEQCWDNEPELRPTVTELIQRVERYKAEARARAAAKGGPVGSGFTFATVAGGAKPECRLWNSKRHTPQRLLWKCLWQSCPQSLRLRKSSSRPSSKICALFQRS
eukprot:TRINITY_DN184_c0_g1_i11.p1 TRINITY_DN184_c0_g1~~TRINITY_DN184_c0_g1_i11.p1  ORF type:complete len:201 (-),score=39.84 TRINITY_DN184_c0_g1_i11:53-625(-)